MSGELIIITGVIVAYVLAIRPRVPPGAPGYIPVAEEQGTMSKDQFLARCATAYDAGLIKPEMPGLLSRWLDFVLRFEGGQVELWLDIMMDERKRKSGRTLANDTEGYDLIRFAAILNHPCQLCGTDKSAWWTRPAFCQHREPK